MSKSTGVRIFVKLLLILLTISIYFYFQHPIIYRSTNLRAVVDVADMKLVIEDISISNLDEDKMHAQIFKGEWPWIYRRIMETNLPVELQLNLVKIASFYTRRPLTNENANLKLTGTLIYPAGIRNSPKNGVHELMDRFDVSLNPGYCNGNGGQFMSGDNYCRWQSHGTFNLNDLDKELSLAITDKISNKVSYIYFTPRWEKERIMQGQEFNWAIGPAQPVQNYINQINYNKTQQALECIAPEARNDFQSPRLDNNFKDAGIRYTVDWEDFLLGYGGAYRITAEAGKYQNEDQTDFVPTTDNKLVFYTVRKSNGKFYIVLAH